MRTTVDLPPVTHARAKQLAEERGESMSAVVADLAARGLAALGEPVVFGRSARTGMPTVTIGRRITSADVARLTDEPQGEA